MVPVSVALLSSDGKESPILQAHAIIMILTQSSKARVKFRVKVNPEESDYVFDDSIYRTYRMLLASPSGSVFAKFDIKLTPVPSLLIPKTYSFVDKSTKRCIPYLQCIFRHIDGLEKKAIADENGVLIVPKLNEQGQWNMVTSSLRCESFFETQRRSLLYLPDHTDDEIPNVCISLKSYHHIQGKGVTFDRISIPPNNHSIPKDLLSAEPKTTISPKGNGNDNGTSGRGGRNSNSNNGVVASVTISLGEVYVMELSKEELHMVAGVIEKGGSTALAAMITQVPVNAQQPHQLQQPQLLQSQSQPSFMIPSSVLVIDAVTTVVPSSDPSSSTSHNSLSVKFRVRINPQTPHEAYNPAIYVKWRVFLGSWSGAVFAKFDVDLKPLRSLAAPKRYVFIDKDTELGISNLICVFEHIDGRSNSLKSNEDGMVLVPELEVEGKWTLNTHSAECDTFFQPYETVLMHCHRRPGDSSTAPAKVSLTFQRCFGAPSENIIIPAINSSPPNPELLAAIPTQRVSPLSTDGVECIHAEEMFDPNQYGKWSMLMGSASGSVFAKYPVTLCPNPTILVPRSYTFKDKDTNEVISKLICVFRNKNGDEIKVEPNTNGVVVVPVLSVEGKWMVTTSSEQCDTFVETFRKDLMRPYRQDSEVNVSMPLVRCFCNSSMPFPMTIPPKTSPPNPELLAAIPTQRVSPLSTDGVECIVDEVYAFDLTKVDLDHIGGEIKRAITDQRIACGLSAVLSRDKQSSVVWVVEGVAMPANSGVGGATVKFRVRVVDVQHAEEMFDPNQYGKWSMLLGSPSGSVFAKYPVTLSPNPTILAPRSYLFVDKVMQAGIPSLQCSFCHTNGAVINVRADDRGVVVLPNLGIGGKWKVETSSEECGFEYEQLKSEILWMGQHVNTTVSEARLLLSKKIGTVMDQLPNPILVNANNIRHWGSTPPTYFQCGIPVSYDQPMVNIGGELERRMRNNTPSALSVRVLHDSDNSPCNLDLMVVAVSRGSGANQFMVKLQANPKDKFDISTYGKRKVELAGPDGIVFVMIVLEILPEIAVCPPKVYEFCDNIKKFRIINPSMITFKNTNGSVQHDFQFNGEMTVPTTIPNGVYEVSASVPGYGDEEPEKVVFYAGPVAREERSKIFLNQLHTLPEGHVRFVLSWAKDPSDLDIHCFNSRQEKVFFNCLSAGGMSLDVDERQGYGPETITIPPLVDGMGYWLYVHHYSSGDGTLSSSDATVKVLLGISQGRVEVLANISIPNGASVNYGSQEGIWEVLSINESKQLWIHNGIVCSSIHHKAFETAGSQMIRQF
eukprot:gene12188-25594_t